MDGIDVQSGCMLPLAQSLVTGGLSGIAVGAFVGLNDGAPVVVFLAAVLIGSLTAGAVWLWLLRWLYRPPAAPVIYYPPAQEPEPEPEPAGPGSLRVEVWQPQEQRADFLDIQGVGWQSLVGMARLIERGESFSHSSLAGGGRPLSRNQFENLRGEFIGRGLAAWVNPAAPAQGVRLTAAGRAVVRRIAEAGGDD